MCSTKASRNGFGTSSTRYIQYTGWLSRGDRAGGVRMLLPTYAEWERCCCVNYTLNDFTIAKCSSSSSGSRCS